MGEYGERKRERQRELQQKNGKKNRKRIHLFISHPKTARPAS